EGRKLRRSLGTKDRVEAERLGRELLANLVLGSAEAEPVPVVRLGELCSAFLAEAPMLRDNAQASQKDAKTREASLCAGLGSERDLRMLGPDDVLNYAARRRAGGIHYAPGRVTAPVKQRTVQADLKQLKMMLRWGCTRTVSGGRRWIESNPLQYVRVQGEN